jgi:hypothetical protein
MLDIFKKLLGKKDKVQLENVEFDEYMKLKESGLERVLGKMYPKVMHAIIPFQVGGAVDMYFFPNAMPGTGFVTMELLDPKRPGPQKSKIGNYELIAFTRRHIEVEREKAEFSAIERRFCGIFTAIGRYSFEAVLNPGETIELPSNQGKPTQCLILDEYKNEGIEFTVGNQKHGLLLLIEVFRSEMEYAMKNGSQAVIQKMKEKGYYPYSDLDREPVF